MKKASFFALSILTLILVTNGFPNLPIHGVPVDKICIKASALEIYTPWLTNYLKISGEQWVLNDAQLLWFFDLEARPVSPIILYDVDNNKASDVIIANPGNILIIDGITGKPMRIITLPRGIDLYPGLSIYKVTLNPDDASAFLYVATGYRIYCYNLLGSLIWQADVPYWIFRIGVIDLDNDKFPEIIVYPYYDQNICILNGVNGNMIKVVRYGRGFGYAIFGDMNNDGIIDIVVGQRDHYLYAIDGREFSILWKTNTYTSLHFPQAIYYDNNLPKILVAHYWSNKIRIFDGVGGKEITTLSLSQSASISTPPVAADINADGVFDIVVGSADYKVYTISTNGEMLWVSDTFGVPTNIVLGDMNGDNYLDAVVVDDYGYIYVFDGRNGNLIWSYNVVSSISVCPAVGDIDGDGLNELVVATDNGFVYAFDFPQGGSRVYWSMFRGSPMSYGNVLFLDRDLDFLSGYSEHLLGTNDSNPDTDSDGIPDWYEVTRHLDPFSNDSLDDPDNDGLTNLQEYQYLTDPFSNDTDSDDLPDGWEVNYSFDPLNATDRALDPDDDMLINWQEYEHGTDPRNPDTDGDGFNDWFEVYNGYNPLDPDNHPPAIMSLGILLSGYRSWIMIGIACVSLLSLGYFSMRRLSLRREIREKELGELIDLMNCERRRTISKVFRRTPSEVFRGTSLAHLAPRVVEGLRYYVSTGDELVAARLSGLSLDEFDDLRVSLHIPRVVFYEEEEE